MFIRMDPISKLVWAMLAAWWLYGLRTILDIVVVSFGIALAAYVGARFNLTSFLKISLIIFAGGWGLLLYQGFVRPGPGIDILGISLSYEGMTLGVALALRTFGLVATGMAFSVSTSPKDMELALMKIRVPYKIARIAYLALRLIPLFQRDVEDINDSQTLRGVKKGQSRFRKSLIALIATEMRQVDTIAIALETRGFGLFNKRTELQEFHVSKTGITLVLITTILMLVHYVVLGLL